MAEKQLSPFMADLLERSGGEGVAQDTLLVSELTTRIADLDEMQPGDAVPSKTLVDAIFAHYNEVLELAQEVAARSGMRLDATLSVEDEAVPVYDFSAQTYDQFLQAEAAFEDELRKGAGGQQTAGATEDTVEVDQGDEEGFEYLEQGELRNVWETVLKKIVFALGISDLAFNVLKPALMEVAGRDVAALTRHVKARHWARARRSLETILNKMRSRRFGTALAKRIGPKMARRILARIAAKFIPVLGWGVVIGRFIWAVARQVS